jgi:peptide/nickel transport system substrate-binding protein
MKTSYWQSVLDRRVSRRRALTATGATTSAAAFLAACGSDDGGSGTSTGDSGGTSLVSQPKDTSSSAKAGGVLKEFANSDPAHLDAQQPLASLNYEARNVYGTLLREEPGHLEPKKGKIIGDAAQSWEFSPDKLTLTLKLRPGIKFHNIAPVNGRTMDMEDIKFNFERYTAMGALRSLMFNEVNADAPITSAEFPDSSTIRIKLKEPLTYIQRYLASYGSFTGNMVIYPREADGGFDPRNQMIGHGPWYLRERVPSVSFKFKRNTDYFEKDAYYPDDLEMPVLTEYAARLAQLKTGNIHFLDMSQNSEDVVSTKQETSALQVFGTDFTVRGEVVTFGMEGDSPYKDERVRQAVSMALDRDLMVDAFYNVSNFAEDGVDVPTRWNTHISGEWQPSGEWLDPKSKEFGENAKYFQYNIAESKKLLSAAGFADGFETTMRYPATVQYTLVRYGEPWAGQLQQILKVKLDAKSDYTKDYIPNLRDANGRYEGLGMHSVTGSTPQRIAPESDLSAQFWSKGGVTFHGFGENGQGDPALDAIIVKARAEFDEKKRTALIHDAQKYLGKAMWALSQPGGGSTFNLVWPAVGNYFAWTNHTWGPSAYWTYKMYLDQTKAPFA